MEGEGLLKVDMIIFLVLEWDAYVGITKYNV